MLYYSFYFTAFFSLLIHALFSVIKLSSWPNVQAQARLLGADSETYILRTSPLTHTHVIVKRAKAATSLAQILFSHLFSVNYDNRKSVNKFTSTLKVQKQFCETMHLSPYVLYLVPLSCGQLGLDKTYSKFQFPLFTSPTLSFVDISSLFF